MKYLKVWTNFADVLAPLADDEIGRLFLFMLHYAETGEEPVEFPGCESFIWPVAKRDIDLMAEKDEKLRQNGSKGGIAKSKNKQALANVSKVYQELPKISKDNQTLANVSLKEIERNEIEINEKELSFIDDDEAHGIQDEQNRVLDAAEDAGFKCSNSERANLLKLYATHGLQKMLEAITSCVKHGATNLAYLEACLKDSPKKAKPKVEAQNFEQRDYKAIQNEIEDRQAERIMQRLKGAV